MAFVTFLLNSKSKTCWVTQKLLTCPLTFSLKSTEISLLANLVEWTSPKLTPHFLATAFAKVGWELPPKIRKLDRACNLFLIILEGPSRMLLCHHFSMTSSCLTRLGEPGLLAPCFAWACSSRPPSTTCWSAHHTVQNLHFLSKNSTLIYRENCRFFLGEKLVKMLWFWTS